MRLWLVLASLGVLYAPMVGAQNLAVNADFDETVDGWLASSDKGAVWQAADEGGCPGSGAAALESDDLFPGFQVATLMQCRPAGDATAVAVSASFRNGGFINQIGVTFHVSADCSDPEPPFATSPTVPASPGGWARVEMPLTEVPPGTESILLGVGGALGSAFLIDLDHIYLGAPERLFAADFESDQVGALQPCRWSSSQP